MTSAPPKVEKIISAIREVVGVAAVSLHEPEFSGNEWAYIKECLDTSFVSSVGKFVDRFEVELAQYTGARYAVAVVNGTAALHLALLLAGVKPNDEVLVPALTFVATANAVNYCGAVPHFVDSESSSLGVDVDKLHDYLKINTKKVGGFCVNNSTGRVIRALVPMHTFGHPGDIDGLLGLAEEFNLALVEDAAESLGSFYRGRHTGTFGLIGALSFNGNKILTTGGGGALLTNNIELAQRAKHLSTTAKLPHAWEYCHDAVGFNYRLPNINAALGCAQLEALPRFLSEKRKLYESYKKAFADVDGIKLFAEPSGSNSNYWLQTLLFDSKYVDLRDKLLADTNNAGVMTRPAWTLMHKLAPFACFPRMNLECAEDLARRIVNVPSSPKLCRSCP